VFTFVIDRVITGHDTIILISEKVYPLFCVTSVRNIPFTVRIVVFEAPSRSLVSPEQLIVKPLLRGVVPPCWRAVVLVTPVETVLWWSLYTLLVGRVVPVHVGIRVVVSTVVLLVVVVTVRTVVVVVVLVIVIVLIVV